MAEIGRELFERLFDGRRMIEWWGRAKGQLSQLRIEVSTSVAAATAIPWELLRDPVTDTPLALEASEFVRSHRDADRQPHIPRTTECIRILLVICRPREDRDVPFRSVASQLVRGLNEDARRQVELTVLRPPTFEQLSRSLHEAKDAGQPFHLVHFDGHGLYADAEAIKDQLGALDALRFDAGRAGAQGFLLFEDPGSQTNSDYISGGRIGCLLAETGTPVLVLNACRSAHAEQRPSRSEPRPTDFDSGQPDGFAAQSLGRQSGAGTGTERAFGSLAQEVMDAGVAGVVAMRYNLWVVTAMRFVYELYCNLVRGLSLGAAVSRGRKQLHAEPRRRIAFQEIPLHAWRLARREEVWDTVVSAMQGLYQLYDHTGRRFEWAALVAAVLPDFVDADDGPLPGRDDQWALVTGYRVGLAELVRDWCEAERLQMRLVEWSRA